MGEGTLRNGRRSIADYAAMVLPQLLGRAARRLPVRAGGAHQILGVAGPP
jgi:hypothetical protein